MISSGDSLPLERAKCLGKKKALGMVPVDGHHLVEPPMTRGLRFERGDPTSERVELGGGRGSHLS